MWRIPGKGPPDHKRGSYAGHVILGRFHMPNHGMRGMGGLGQVRQGHRTR